MDFSSKHAVHSSHHYCPPKSFKSTLGSSGAERNLVNDPLINKLTRVTQEGEMMSCIDPPSDKPTSKPEPRRVHQTCIIPTQSDDPPLYSKVQQRSSCPGGVTASPGTDTDLKLHLDTEHPPRAGRTRRLPVCFPPRRPVSPTLVPTGA